MIVLMVSHRKIDDIERFIDENLEVFAGGIPITQAFFLIKRAGITSEDKTISKSLKGLAEQGKISLSGNNVSVILS